MYRVLLILVAFSAALISSTKTSQAVEVYLFRGAGDFSFVQKSLHFSRGLDKMAKLLAEAGIHSRITRWENTVGIYREISRRRPQSVAFYRSFHGRNSSNEYGFQNERPWGAGCLCRID